MDKDPKQREFTLLQEQSKLSKQLLSGILYLCKYAVLSVVLLQDVLEGQLDLLLEFLHFHLLLEPGPVWKENLLFVTVKHTWAPPASTRLTHGKRGCRAINIQL